ncbi:MAG: DUF3606 domain-containing protein [Giesbergeria sp.]|nr:DUF3606 domain-containing protein [Giesbergeria sp.]
MTSAHNTSASAGITPDRINPHSSAEVTEWAKKLDVTESQVIDAVAAVGELATDVEMHLKGTRSTTNSDRVEELKRS